ncbi:MAG TPA: ornithine cyclodeaminase family protein [Gemmatimonadaceae bacterium]|nr:ornithine cyclodeaminase family protein [Gemmatimonadaceae bacterium]
MSEPTRLFTRSDVERLLDVRSCISAVETAFRLRGSGATSPSAVLGVHVDRGGFHAKAAYLELARPYFALKVNANFPGNPGAHSLPTIQGVLMLFDATRGVPVAVMDSAAITTLRTAAASAVAADNLARPDAHTATFIGCGVQARAHVAAISAIRDLRQVYVFDIDKERGSRFASELRERYAFSVTVAPGLRDATRASEIIVTTTPANQPFLGADQVCPGAFVAAVGADNEHKRELELSLLREAAVVVDDTEQCATIGDLHHAIEAGVLTREDVRATLAEVVAGSRPGRLRDDEIVVFDSTGVAIEDVAAASIVFERAALSGAGLAIHLRE